MRFDLGYGTRNVLLNGSNAEAAYRQTPTEHEEALHKYERPGQTPAERLIATEQGMIEEQMLPKYWNDTIPRRDVGGSSSWINGIEYLPDFGLAIMNTKGREYYYPATNEEMGDWITSDSIGGTYNEKFKQRG